MKRPYVRKRPPEPTARGRFPSPRHLAEFVVTQRRAKRTIVAIKEEAGVSLNTVRNIIERHQDQLA